MYVPFQTPTAPGVAPDAVPTTISEENMKPQTNDSYQPIDKADHSKEWTRAGAGSEVMLWIIGSSVNVGRFAIRVRVSALEEDWNAVSGTLGMIAEMMVRIVCKGSSGSQDSS
jgi:hypothetical protein